MTDRAADAADHYRLDPERLHPRLAEAYLRLAAKELPPPATSSGGAAFVIALLAMIGFYTVGRLGGLIAGGWAAILLGLITYWVAAVYLRQQQAGESRVQALADPATIRRLLPKLTKGADAATEAYGEVVLALAEGTDTEIADAILREANALLTDSDALAEQAKIIEQASDGHSVEWRRAEVRDLERRVSAATDPMTREALGHSLELARETLKSTEALHVVRGRIEAQQEAILHAFTGLRATLGRLRLAATALQSPDLSQIREMTARVHGQSRAVEAAVEEVVALRAG